MVRFPAVWAVILLLSSSIAMPAFFARLASGQDEPVKQPSLAELLKFYREWELPLPPKEANLVRIAQNTPEDKDSTFAWEISEPRVGKPGIILRSLQKEALFTIRERYFPVPTPEAVLRHVKFERVGGHYDDDAANATELLLGIQCHHAGHDELARFFYSRCKTDEEYSLKDSLRAIAWGYWTTELTDATRDRLPIAKILKRFVGPNDGAEEGSEGELLRILDLTLSPSRAKPGSIEAMIDALVDYKKVNHSAVKGYNRTYDHKPEDRWDESKFEAWQWNFRQSEPEVYSRLERSGLDAIAPLIEHVDDERLTREFVGLSLSGQPVPNSSRSYVKVGQLARRLLRVYLEAEFPGAKNDYDLNKEDYKKIIDRTKGINQYDYFINLLNKKGDGRVIDKIDFLYKGKIIDIYRLMIEGEMERSCFLGIADCVMESGIPKAEKTDLLIKGMAKMDAEGLLFMLPKLAKLDRAKFVKQCKNLLAKSAAEIDRGMDSEFPMDLAALTLGYDDPELLATVVELTKKMPAESRFIFLVRKLNGRGYFITKRNFYTVMGSFLNDKIVVDKGPTYLPDSWEKIEKIEMRNAAAFWILEAMGMEHGLDDQTSDSKWEEVRNFVKSEVQRVMEETKRK